MTAVDPKFEVEVVARCAARFADPPNLLATFHFLSLADIIAGKVGIIGLHTAAMVDDDKTSIAFLPSTEDDLARFGSTDFSPALGRDVDTAMEAAPALAIT